MPFIYNIDALISGKLDKTGKLGLGRSDLDKSAVWSAKVVWDDGDVSRKEIVV